MNFLKCCFIVVSFILAVGEALSEEKRVAAVSVTVYDTFGRPIPGAKVTLTSVVPGEQLTAVGGEARFGTVPFGIYDVQVRLNGFIDRKERLNISQPVLGFRIGLELGSVTATERSKLFGSISPGLKGRTNLWVRLVAIYGSDLIENVVDSSSRFELAGMAPGKYLILLFQNDQMLEIKPVEVLGGKQFIDLTNR